MQPLRSIAWTLHQDGDAYPTLPEIGVVVALVLLLREQTWQAALRESGDLDHLVPRLVQVVVMAGTEIGPLGVSRLRLDMGHHGNRHDDRRELDSPCLVLV